MCQPSLVWFGRLQSPRHGAARDLLSRLCPRHFWLGTLWLGCCLSGPVVPQLETKGIASSPSCVRLAHASTLRLEPGPLVACALRQGISTPTPHCDAGKVSSRQSWTTPFGSMCSSTDFSNSMGDVSGAQYGVGWISGGSSQAAETPKTTLMIRNVPLMYTQEPRARKHFFKLPGRRRFPELRPLGLASACQKLRVDVLLREVRPHLWPRTKAYARMRCVRGHGAPQTPCGTKHATGGKNLYVMQLYLFNALSTLGCRLLWKSVRDRVRAPMTLPLIRLRSSAKSGPVGRAPTTCLRRGRRQGKVELPAFLGCFWMTSRLPSPSLGKGGPKHLHAQGASGEVGLARMESLPHHVHLAPLQ